MGQDGVDNNSYCVDITTVQYYNNLDYYNNNQFSWWGSATAG